MFNRLLDGGKRRYFHFPKSIQEVEGQCKECGGSLIRDAETGELFCSICGLVQESTALQKSHPPRKSIKQRLKKQNILNRPEDSKTP